MQPYRSVKLDFLAKEINISTKEVRQLLSELILEQRIDASIDQLSGFLEMNQRDAVRDMKHVAMEQWASTLVNIHMNLTNVQSF